MGDNMFEKFTDKFKKKTDSEAANIQPPENTQESISDLTTKNLKAALSKSPDFKFRQIFINDDEKLPVTLVFLDGMVDSALISDFIIKPLFWENKFSEIKSLDEAYKLIEKGVLHYAAQDKADNLDKVIGDIISGQCALVFDELKKAFIFDTKGFEKRAISEPTNENVTKGPKDSFSENIRVNTATVRRSIKSKNLIIENMVIGKQTNTPVSIFYMENIVNPELLRNVKERLSKINIDKLLSTSVLEESLSGNNTTLFPQVRATERPDSFCSCLLEGRVGIIADELPIGLIVPGTFAQYLQAPEDFARNSLISSLTRLMRYILMLSTLILPGFYIAVTTFNPELLPTDLVVSIAGSKQDVPFTTPVETLLMLLAFEVIYEAGIRMPKNIGSTVTIVGGLIVGQAAVEAKILSPAVVIVIAVTAIASFTMPSQDLSSALRIWRFILAIAASIMGQFGLMIGLLVLLLRLCRLELFGIAYLAPMTSSKKNVLQDTLFRLPFSKMKYRPDEMEVINKRRVK